ncbi:hypothetical protein BDV18DRAFT_84417 [Aspergillus unguis]
MSSQGVSQSQTLLIAPYGGFLSLLPLLSLHRLRSFSFFSPRDRYPFCPSLSFIPCAYLYSFSDICLSLCQRLVALFTAKSYSVLRTAFQNFLTFISCPIAQLFLLRFQPGSTLHPLFCFPDLTLGQSARRAQGTFILALDFLD